MGKIFRAGYQLPDVPIFTSSIVFGFDGTIPSSKSDYRTTPAIYFSDFRVSSNYIDNAPPQAVQHITDHYQITFTAFVVNFDWFILDLKTPSQTLLHEKTGNWLKKGLFLQLAPSIQLISANTNNRTGSLIDHLLEG